MWVKRYLTLPAEYEPRIRALLETLGYSLERPKDLIEAVLRLSDYYNQQPDAPTPWDEKWAQAASIAYFFPLNYSRARAVANQGRKLGFFLGLDTIFDFGAGQGSGFHAVSDELSGKLPVRAVDVSSDALDLAKKLNPNLSDLKTSRIAAASDKRPELFHGSKTALVASYVLTELKEMPAWWLEAEALVLIEPSIQSDARRLQAQRELLIANGFRLWAPCTHEQACPLLVDSVRDWCHDRIHFSQPTWFEAIERHLPMKNRTITHSYLLARKTPAPAELSSYARMVGDPLDEKGKSRQAICRGPQKEFLAWFPQRFKKGTPSVDLDRGDLVELADGLQKKSNEIRLTDPADARLIELSEH